MEIDIRHIAKLAKLRIEDSELDMFQENMQNIVNMVEKLPALNVDAGVIDSSNPMKLRPDEVHPSLRREKVLANAPQAAAGCFVVPKTVE